MFPATLFANVWVNAAPQARHMAGRIFFRPPFHLLPARCVTYHVQSSWKEQRHSGEKAAQRAQRRSGRQRQRGGQAWWGGRRQRDECGSVVCEAALSHPSAQVSRTDVSVLALPAPLCHPEMKRRADETARGSRRCRVARLSARPRHASSFAPLYARVCAGRSQRRGVRAARQFRQRPRRGVCRCACRLMVARYVTSAVGLLPLRVMSIAVSAAYAGFCLQR